VDRLSIESNAQASFPRAAFIASSCGIARRGGGSETDGLF
jgi:hypothetical protein